MTIPIYEEVKSLYQLELILKPVCEKGSFNKIYDSIRDVGKYHGHSLYYILHQKDDRLFITVLDSLEKEEIREFSFKIINGFIS